MEHIRVGLDGRRLKIHNALLGACIRLAGLETGRVCAHCDHVLAGVADGGRFVTLSSRRRKRLLHYLLVGL